MDLLTLAMLKKLQGSGGGSSGGESGGASGIYMGEVTLAEDVKSLTIQHDLGTTDILFALIWAETLGNYTPTTNNVVANVWLKTDIPVRVSSSINRENLELYSLYNTSGSHINTAGLKTAGQYLGKPKDENNFYMKAAASANAVFYGSVTYTVIIMAASAFSGV